MADPFDFSGGASPDFWRNLMMFGGSLAASANARTPQGFLAYGPGFAGPFGAALTATGQQSIDYAKARSAMGLQGAETQNSLADAQLKRAQIPYLQAQLKMMNDPSMWRLPELPSGLGADASQPGTAAPQTATAGPTPPGSSYARGIATMESNGNPSADNPAFPTARGGPLGAHQFTAGTWGDFAKANPQVFGNMSPDQVMAARSNPELSAAATDWYAKQNAPILQANGIEPSAQNLGMAHRLGPAGAAGVLKFPDQAPLAQVLQVTQPHTAAAVITQNRISPDTTVGDFKRQFSGLSFGGGGGGTQYAQAGNVATDAASAPAQPTPMPQGNAPQGQNGQYSAPQPQPTALPQGMQPDPRAMAISRQYENLATNFARIRQPVPAYIAEGANAWRNVALSGARASQEALAKAQVELATAGLIAGVQETAKRAAGLPFVGPEERAKAGNSNIGLRQGEQSRVFNPDGTWSWVKNPEYRETQDAQGNTVPMHIIPAPPGSPPGTPGEATPILGPNGQPVVTKLPQDVQEARNKVTSDFMGKDTDSYLAAQNTQSWLAQMDHAADTLNAEGGWTQTGPTNPARMKFASTINDIARTVGIAAPFDPGKVASWEEYKKATTTAGFELSSHYEGHARQAAQTIMNATAAVPSPENSPVGAKLVTAGIQEAAQSAIDLHQYKQDVFNQNGDLTRAETDFYKQNPAQLYARRAISRVTPYPVSTDKELSRYLPGTFVKYKDRFVQVPERPGAPPIPEYLQGAAPIGGGG